MKPEDLIEETDQLRHSSCFSYGDAMTFRVPLLTKVAELPGPCDPFAYLAPFQGEGNFQGIAGQRVAILGAGNGGLAAAALDIGAREIVAIEPRHRFYKALDRVVGLLNRTRPHPNSTPDNPLFRSMCFFGWPAQNNLVALGKFDLIVWPEGLEECQEPAATLAAALQLLNQNGRLVVEVATGQSEQTPLGQVNSWRPTREAFGKLLNMIDPAAAVSVAPGRSLLRFIYAVAPVAPKSLDPSLESQTALPPFPRHQPARLLHHVGYRLDPLNNPLPSQPQAASGAQTL